LEIAEELEEACGAVAGSGPMPPDGKVLELRQGDLLGTDEPRAFIGCDAAERLSRR
jgi:hypothetical protein